MAEDKTGRLLVVDDEIDTLTPLCDLLSEWGYEVTRCTSGKEALESLNKQQFDVLLADLVMPEIDGIALIKEAIQIDPLLVSIIITGQGTIETAVDAMKNGAFDYILKPIEWKLLRPIISRAMETRKLRESERQYRSIVEDQTELICRWKPGEILTYVNAVYCRFFDKKPEELIGHSFISHIFKEDHEKVRQHFASLTQENPVSMQEHRVLCADGKICWQQWTNRAIFNKEGTIIEYQSVGRDITEQKKMENALKDEQFKLREYFESLPVPAYNIALDGKVIDCNNVTLDTLGYDTKDELIGKPVISTIYAPSSQEKARQLFGKWKKWGKLKNEELQIITKQGEIKDVLLNVDTIYDRRGNPLYSVSTQLDITERKRAEEELTYSRTMLQTVLDSIPSAVFWKDRDLKYIGGNRIWLQTVGWTSSEEVVGKSDYDLPWEKEQADSFREHDRNVIESGISEHDIIESFTRADGTVGWARTTKTPLRDVNDNIIGVLGTYEDITDYKRAEKALKEEELRRNILMQKSCEGIAIIDQGHRVIEANQRFAEMLGYSPEEVIGLHTWDWEAVMTEAEIRANFADLTKTNVVFETRHRRKDGTVFDVEVSASGTKVGDNPMVFTICRDITERKKAEEALRYSETRFRELFENMGSGVAIYRAINDGEDFVFIDFNKGGEEIDHLTRENIIGKPVTEVFPGIKKFGLFDVFQRVWLSGKPEYYPVSFYRDERLFGWRENYVYKLPTGEIVSIYQDKTEQKQAEEQLQFLSSMVEQSIDSIISTDTNFLITYMNKAAEELYGWTLDELKGETPGIFNAEPDGDEIQKKIYATVSSGNSYSRSALNRRKDGSTFYCHFKISPLFNKNGEIYGYMGSQRDITDLVRSTEALQESEAKYRDLYNNAPDMYHTLDENGLIIDCNETEATMLRYKKEEIIGRHIKEFFTEESSRLFESDFPKLGEKKELYNLEREFVRKDGTTFTVILNVSANFDKTGNFIGTKTIARDITERKKTEDALKHNQRIFQNLFNNTAVGMFRTSLDGSEILNANEKFLKIFGRTREEVIGKPSVIHWADPRQREEMVRKLKASGRVIDFECKMLNKNGEVRDCLTSLNLYPEEGILDVSIIDITERKKAEEALRTSEAQLSNALKIARMGHWEYDVATNLFTFNDNFYAIFRTTAEEVGGYTMSPAEYARRFLHPDDMYMVGLETRKALETTDPNYSRQLEHRIIYADGTTGHIAVRFFIVKDEKGRTVKTYGVNQDITERKLAEEEYRTILQTAMDGFTIDDMQGHILEANDAYCRLVGYTRDELTNMRISDIEVAESHAKVAQRIKKIKEIGSDRFETRHRRKDGRTVDVEISVNYLGTGGGRLFVFVRDITERKMAEDSLRESEEKYRLHFENANDVIYSVDPEFKIVSISPSVKTILGYEPEELIGRKFQNLNIIAPQSIEAAFSDTMHVLSGKSISASVYEFIAKDGTRRYGEVSGSPLIRDGKVVAVVSVARDITERKKAEDTAKELQKEIEFILGATKTGLDIIDSDFNIRYIDPEWQKIYGDPAGTKCYEYFMGRSEACPKCGLLTALATNQITVTEEVLIKEGNRPVQVTSIPFQNAAGEWLFAEVNTDITERKRAEEALRESEERYRTQFEEAIDAMFLADIETGILVDCNMAASKLLEREKSDIIGKHQSFLHPAEDIKDGVSKSFKSHIKDVSSELLEERVITKSGEIRDVAIRASKLYIKGKEVLQGIFRDITEQKETARKIRESENRLMSIFRTAPVGIGVISSPDRIIMDVNDEFCKMLGYYESELVGNNAQKVYPTVKEYNRVGKEKNKQIKKYGVGTIETRFQRKDSRIIDVILNSSPIDRTDLSKGITFTVLNITDRKKAEAEIRESEERLRSLADAALEGIVFHKKGILLRANDRFARIFGYKPGELLGKDILKLLIAPEEKEFVKKQIVGRETGPYESIGRRKNGTKFPVEIRARETELEGQKIRVATLMDITERKQAEAALRASEEKYRLIVENQTDLVVKVDTKGRFSYVSPSYCKTFGKTEKQILGKKFMPLVHKDDRKLTANAMKNLYKPPYTCKIEQRALTKDGWRWLAWSDKAVLDKQNKVVEIVGVGRDVTERKQFEERLEISYSHLRTLSARISEVEEAERRQLARELHDQVGQNLTALSINLNTLPSLVSPGEAIRIKDRIDDTQKLLDETTLSIRNVMADLRPSVLDDYGLVAAIRWYSHKFSERTGTHVKITGKELKSRLPGFLETTLYRITQEALTNISKHAMANSAHIYVNEAEDGVKLTIADDGKGFNPATVFKKKKQTVWGLLTIKERAEAIGGTMKVESSPGKGTKIIVEIKR